jgi:hypothetical protein
MRKKEIELKQHFPNFIIAQPHHTIPNQNVFKKRELSQTLTNKYYITFLTMLPPHFDADTLVEFDNEGGHVSMGKLGGGDAKYSNQHNVSSGRHYRYS